MTRKRISRAHDDLCAEQHPDDGKPWLWTKDHSGPRDPEDFDDDAKPDRKTLQLCAQIERALHTAWPAHLGRLALLGVEPAGPGADASRLELVIGVPEGVAASGAARAVQGALPALRAEAARAITRKRTPTFTFRLAPMDAGGDERATPEEPGHG